MYICIYMYMYIYVYMYIYIYSIYIYDLNNVILSTYLIDFLKHPYSKAGSQKIFFEITVCMVQFSS